MPITEVFSQFKTSRIQSKKPRMLSMQILFCRLDTLPTQQRQESIPPQHSQAGAQISTEPLMSPADRKRYNTTATDIVTNIRRITHNVHPQLTSVLAQSSYSSEPSPLSLVFVPLRTKLESSSSMFASSVSDRSWLASGNSIACRTPSLSLQRTAPVTYSASLHGWR